MSAEPTRYALDLQGCLYEHDLGSLVGYLQYARDTAALREQVGEYRRLLIETGRAVGAVLSDEVSLDFLRHVPEEARLKVAALTEERDRLAEGEYRGNAVQHWHAKATAYGEAFSAIFR